MLKAADMLALAARSEARHSLAIISMRPQRATLGLQHRMLLSRVALHIEVGLRLRLDPQSVVAVLKPDGRLVHADGNASARDVRERLSTHVARIDRARLQRHRTKAESIDTWLALAAGRFGFVERDGLQREYLVLTNSDHHARSRRWSPAEARAVELSAAGMQGKLVAYALGVSSGEVSRLLASAAAKAGFANRTSLIKLSAILKLKHVENRSRALDSLRLSESEREILVMLQQGLSNNEIAQLRGTALRTVANQVASVLRKAGLPSRRALATLTE
jgi:DNA-binding CsgD family transcriptional regulator